jgi:hypothetical protein
MSTALLAGLRSEGLLSATADGTNGRGIACALQRRMTNPEAMLKLNYVPGLAEPR